MSLHDYLGSISEHPWFRTLPLSENVKTGLHIKQIISITFNFSKCNTVFALMIPVIDLMIPCNQCHTTKHGLEDEFFHLW